MPQRARLTACRSSALSEDRQCRELIKAGCGEVSYPKLSKLAAKIVFYFERRVDALLIFVIIRQIPPKNVNHPFLSYPESHGTDIRLLSRFSPKRLGFSSQTLGIFVPNAWDFRLKRLGFLSHTFGILVPNAWESLGRLLHANGARHAVQKLHLHWPHRSPEKDSKRR